MSDVSLILVVIVFAFLFIGILASLEDTPEKKAKREQEARRLKQEQAKQEHIASRSRLLAAATNSSEDWSVRKHAQDFILADSPSQREVETFADMGNLDAVKILLRQKYFPAGRSRTAGCSSMLSDNYVNNLLRKVHGDSADYTGYKLQIIYGWFDSSVCDGSLSELIELQRIMSSLTCAFYLSSFLEQLRLNIPKKRFEQIRDGK